MERSVEVRVFSTAPFDGGMIYADNKEAKSIVDVLLSGAFFAGSSQMVFPLWPVPVTMQIFAIFFVGLLLSPRKSFFSVLVWLFAGSVCLLSQVD